MSLSNNYSVVIASEVGGERDGLGIEVYLEGKLILDIFRDDTKKTRQVSFFQSDISLDVVEASIAEFKKEIPWEFQD
ncbi:hypothetical protein [Pseudoalteromonas sp. T1lg122]|uniref:hypothetical protein n=1 Tax=Pseudoalteromonas sp. T1lg122 TaxID=2077094 RepID=UPI000CF72B28|nr:hypothetical protein [Pseudoalteromonas sp. T1lg122]